MMPFHPWVDGDLLTAPAFRGARSRRSRSSSAPPRTRWSCSATRCRRCPKTSRCASSRRRPPTSASPTRRACAPGSARVRRRPGRSRRRPRAPRAERAHGARPRAARATRCGATGSTGRRPMRGACHALDLPFTFGTLDVARLARLRRRAPARAAPTTLSRPHARGVDVVRGHRAAVGRGRSGRGPTDSSSVSAPTRPSGHDDAVARRVGHLAGRRDDAARWTVEVAIVTGASRGIGKGCALELGAAGATVYVTGRSVSESDHPLPGTVGATAARDRRARRHRRRGRARPSRRRRGRRAVRSRRRRARAARRPREQRVHRHRRAHVGSPVLGGCRCRTGTT